MIARSDHKRGLLIAFVGILILTPDGLLYRLIDTASYWNVLFLRSLFLGVSVSLYLFCHYRNDIWRIIGAMGWPGWFVAVLTACVSIFVLGAFENTTIANALVIFASMPFFGAIFAWLLIRESLPSYTLIAMAIAFFGVVIVFTDGFSLNGNVGDFFALAFAITQGFILAFMRRYTNFELLTTVAFGGFIGAIFSFSSINLAEITAHDLSITFLMGIFILPVSLCMQIKALSFLPAGEVALFILLETVIGPLWVWYFLNESPDIETFIGGTIILVALSCNAIVGLRKSR